MFAFNGRYQFSEHSRHSKFGPHWLNSLELNWFSKPNNNNNNKCRGPSYHNQPCEPNYRRVFEFS